MNAKRFTLILLLALAGVPASAYGQDPQQRIDAARRRAETVGIPVSLLESKVAEGRAKGVPMDRIAAAVEQRLAVLVRARDAMAGVPRGAPLTAADLSVGADALNVGVEPGILGRLGIAAPPDRRAVAIAVLTQLVSEGESSERALQRVQSALTRGAEALRRLPGEAASERGRGPPAHAGGNARGRGQGGPPPSVPGPTERPERGKGRGRPD